MCSLVLTALTCLTIWLGHLMSICCGHQSLSAMWSRNHCKTTRFGYMYWHGKTYVYQCITCTNTVLNCMYMYVKSCQVCKYLHCEHFLQIFNKHSEHIHVHSFTWKSKSILRNSMMFCSYILNLSNTYPKNNLIACLSFKSFMQVQYQNFRNKSNHFLNKILQNTDDHTSQAAGQELNCFVRSSIHWSMVG